MHIAGFPVFCLLFSRTGIYTEFRYYQLTEKLTSICAIKYKHLSAEAVRTETNACKYSFILKTSIKYACMTSSKICQSGCCHSFIYLCCFCRSNQRGLICMISYGDAAASPYGRRIHTMLFSFDTPMPALFVLNLLN